MKENEHVVPRKDGWAVKKSKAKKASRIFKEKLSALRYAQKLASKRDSCVVPHTKEGKIQDTLCNMEPRFQHVVPRKGRWSVESEGSTHQKTYDTKGSALLHAYRTSKRNSTCMFVHDKKGMVENVVCSPDESPSPFQSIRMILGI